VLRTLRARLQPAGLPVDEATFRGIEATSPPDGD
jgi:hypothetical protein